MTAFYDPERAWLTAYLHGIGEHVTFDEHDWPQCSADALFALVNLGVKVRDVTRGQVSPLEMTARRLTFATDELLAILLAPGDEAADREVVATWRQAWDEMREFMS
ncbi:hypothetical protein [Mycobacterium kyorinense]|uniref:Uncharacterized protein n=1 Tax=Mycobacterium kyorinense TaxID=487514 RepID=A0A1X1XUN2_9MYCO|nr:hypothetical protein [Mycobacterium kyorinense]ORW02470.1 hypothetical protein AWC14_06970 [Mycobacterium kyorinense]